MNVAADRLETPADGISLHPPSAKRRRTTTIESTSEPAQPKPPLEIIVILKQPISNQLSDWKMAPGGSRKGNDILYDPECCQYTRHQSRKNTWKCSKMLTNNRRCGQLVFETVEGEIVKYNYDSKTTHGEHKL